MKRGLLAFFYEIQDMCPIDFQNVLFILCDPGHLSYWVCSDCETLQTPYEFQGYSSYSWFYSLPEYYQQKGITKSKNNFQK